MAELVENVPVLNTEESLPEENIEESEALEEEVEQSSEETEKPAEETPTEVKTSRATERIQQLIAEKNALKAERDALKSQQQPQLEGVDESGIDPEKFARSAADYATSQALSAMEAKQQFTQAESNFPLVKESNLVRARAAELYDQGYTPLQAAEVASLEFEQTQETILSKNTLRKEAGSKIREGSQIPSAGKINPEMTFDEDTVSRMSLDEYAKYREQIFKENGIG